jgi:hypothetical protein
MEKLRLNLFNVRSVLLKKSPILVPLFWMALGLVCWLCKTDLARAVGFVVFFVGLGGLVYNLLKKNH